MEKVISAMKDAIRHMGALGRGRNWKRVSNDTSLALVAQLPPEELRMLNDAITNALRDMERIRPAPAPPFAQARSIELWERLLNCRDIARVVVQHAIDYGNSPGSALDALNALQNVLQNYRLPR